MNAEICTKCENETGRAGHFEDSLYAGSFGPYCEDCWADVPHQLAENLEKSQSRIAELEAQLAKADPQGVFATLDEYAKENAALKKQLSEAVLTERERCCAELEARRAKANEWTRAYLNEDSEDKDGLAAACMAQALALALARVAIKEATQ